MDYLGQKVSMPSPVVGSKRSRDARDDDFVIVETVKKATVTASAATPGDDMDDDDVQFVSGVIE
jgi:hypothetical protein